MSILNMTNDGLPALVPLAVKALMTFGEIPRDRLVELCAPEPQIDPKIFRSSLNRWVQLGLFRENGDKLRFAEDYVWLKRRSPGDVSVRLPGVLRELVFHPMNNANFWAAEENLSADFSRALSWLLAQDVYHLPANFEQIQVLESRQIGNVQRRIMQNNTRWNGLSTWGAYLGFAWGEVSFMVDPSVAIRETLPVLFKDGGNLSADDFVHQLAQHLPVLDFGAYRQQVEEEMKSSAWQPPAANMLSTSLSRALKRLEVVGVLGMEARSDAGQGYGLTGQGGREWGRFTHVWYQGEA